MRISILGPLVVTDDAGEPIPISGARVRAVIARLALDPGRPVHADALIDAVWGEAPPAGATNALQTLVSRLRRTLGADLAAVAIGDATGYALHATVDAAEFESLARAARDAPDATSARDGLAAALALWRGDAFADVADAEFARPTIVRLAEARTSAREAWFGSRLTIEPPSGLIGELEVFAADHPLREQPHALLIGALASAGRQADAVVVYEQLRSRLSEQLGLDPSPELAGAYASMLRGERAGNVRTPYTSFVGRDTDLARLIALIREQRLVTLVGPGGAGKTRLATEAARVLRAEFAGGVWSVELAPVRDPDDVARAIAEALQLRELRFFDMTQSARAFDRVLAALETKDLLLILDNCEHLIGAAAGLVDTLLRTCEGVRVLTTSREPLAITGETLLPVPPLATSPAGAALDDVRNTAAVRLFVDRAAAVKPGFALTAANVDAVAEICRRLDGMPLAIELACARMRTMPVDQIARRLDDRFRLLTGGSRTALARHQTLQAVVDWTWDLLSAPERTLAERFSVFLDGATSSTIDGMSADDDSDALRGLVDKSFVVLGDDGRYRMLETIRAFAAERLADTGATAAVRDAHARYFADVAAVADLHIRGHGQVLWLRWLSEERDNLSGALRWAIDSGDAPTAVGLAGSLGWFWLLCDFHDEASSNLSQALALPGEVPDDVRALALAHYGITQMIHDDREPALETLRAVAASGSEHPVVALSQIMGPMFGSDPSRAWANLPTMLEHADPWVRAMGRTMAGLLNIFGGDADRAEAELGVAVVEFEAVGDLWARAMVGAVLGEIRGLHGDQAGAITMLQTSAALAEELGVPDVAAQMYVSLALQRARTGDLRGAEADLEHARARSSAGVSPQAMVQLNAASAEVIRRGGDVAGAHARYRDALAQAATVRAIAKEILAGLLLGMALTEIDLGDVDTAYERGAQIVEAVPNVADRIALCMAAAVFAAVASARGAQAEAAYMLGVADAIRGVADDGNPDLAAITATARGRLGDQAFADAHARGRDLDLPSAIDALHVGAAHRGSLSTWGVLSDLPVPPDGQRREHDDDPGGPGE